MTGTVLPFGPGGLAVVGLYLASLLVVGWLGHRARREDSLRDFYLGGGSIGFTVLVLTLYATQYSGNTMFGFTGKAYRIGWTWLSSVHFMTAIIVGYLLFAPWLHRLAQRQQFITPADFLRHRYGNRGIDLLAPLVMTLALANYLLAQLVAMGRAMQGLTTADPVVAFAWGVVLLAGIMLVYETMGGFRAVAWTDVIQGIALAIGFGALLVMVFSMWGWPGETTRVLLDGGEQLRARVLPPGARASRNWVSYVIIFGLGAALYPQAIQRIYAARSGAVLRRSLAVMVFLPLLSSLVAVTVGVTAAAHVPGLEGAAADRVLSVVFHQVQASSAFGYWLVVLLFAAVLGALMSTADSCLLTISSMITRDLYQGFLRPDAGQAHLTRVGKLVAWAMVAAAAGTAIWMEGQPGRPTLVRLLDMKFDMLVQLVPAFMLGMHWSRLGGNAVLAGMLAGLTLTFGLYGNATVDAWGVHHGLLGLLLNLAVAVTWSFARPGVQEREWTASRGYEDGRSHGTN
ncbi:MAG TPA: sodium:solute symporter family protein [Deltaproteobacteria bacterium]|nr:sodium:solute symporter family protein [Candidatus Binatota bacterium]HIL14004.1 sodium:solute symporter family protein [Deltaproteobacteria bacterium]